MVSIMQPIMQPFMDVESSRSYIDELYSPDIERCVEAIICLKNSVIGSNRQKANVISQGVVPRLLQLIGDNMMPLQIKVEATITLGSLAKGTEDHVKALVDLGVVPVLINGLLSEESRLIEACLRCLRTIFEYPCAPVATVCQDENLPLHLLSLIPHSVSNQVCVATILTAGCKTADNQNLLCSQGAVPALAALLCSPHYKVQMPSLRCLANMCFQNQKVSSVVSTSSFGGKSVPDLLIGLMARDKPSEMQMAAARCITYMHRAGAIGAEDPKILYRTLPCLVRLCKKDRPCEERVTAAETLAYLTEVNTELQRLASISNHLVPTLAELLRYQPEPSVQTNPGQKLEQEVKIAQDMKQAAFRAFASLGANDEDIRKKIIETDNLMDHIVSGLQDPSPRVRLAAVRCLHSLSRSVQQLRTTFQDHSVWRPLMQLLQGACDDILTVASSTLCNLLLEFSPSKEPILESGAVDLLCGLTRRQDPALRLNGIWALMNMAFQAEQKIKSQILHALGTDQIFRLLSDPEVGVLMKTLGLLRNLLSTKPHIDHIMGLHGNQIMQAVVLILEGTHSAEVKEQALCILANIGDGESAKEYIMANEDVLKKLTDYMRSTEQLKKCWENIKSRRKDELSILERYCMGTGGGSHKREETIDDILTVIDTELSDTLDSDTVALSCNFEGNYIASADNVLECTSEDNKPSPPGETKRVVRTHFRTASANSSLMMHSNVKLQIAAIFCISNLVWREEPGSSERQARLRDLGVYKLLQQLIMTSDTLLFDKVKTAMTQFSDA